jgi:hypothetical protein
MKTKILSLILFGFVSIATAQVHVRPDTSLLKKSIWDKKFFLGLTYNNCLVGIKGNHLPQKYFMKPAMGVTLRSEYYFLKNIGLSIGFGYQQKGSGIITPDKISYQQNLGDPDSTHRARIKFNALEFPIALLLRSNEWIKGTRFHASIGINPMLNVYSKYVFYSIEDGFHTIENHSKYYYKNDLPISASFGLDVNAGNAAVFQIHFVGNWGTKNVYNTTYFPGQNGKNILYGIRLGWMF